jgi:hypothetical protein
MFGMVLMSSSKPPALVAAAMQRAHNESRVTYFRIFRHFGQAYMAPSQLTFDRYAASATAG